MKSVRDLKAALTKAQAASEAAKKKEDEIRVQIEIAEAGKNVARFVEVAMKNQKVRSGFKEMYAEEIEVLAGVFAGHYQDLLDACGNSLKTAHAEGEKRVAEEKRIAAEKAAKRKAKVAEKKAAQSAKDGANNAAKSSENNPKNSVNSSASVVGTQAQKSVNSTPEQPIKPPAKAANNSVTQPVNSGTSAVGTQAQKSVNSTPEQPVKTPVQPANNSATQQSNTGAVNGGQRYGNYPRRTVDISAGYAATK